MEYNNIESMQNIPIIWLEATMKNLKIGGKKNGKKG